MQGIYWHTAEYADEQMYLCMDLCHMVNVYYRACCSAGGYYKHVCMYGETKWGYSQNNK
jgi:hypothetical protein